KNVSVVESFPERRPLEQVTNTGFRAVLLMRSCVAILVATTVLLFSIGCGGKKSAAPSSKDLQAFNSAAPDIKQMWETALQADKTNDYATAETLLYALVRPELTKEQQDAVSHRLTSVKQRLDE